MNRGSLATFLFVLTLAAAPAQQLPLEFRQTDTLNNFQSQRGVPISSVTNNPVGSDGRAPSPGSGSVGTMGQFQKMLGFSGGVQGTNAARGGTGPNAIALTRARLGNPIVSRSFAFYFGDVIPVPAKDEYGIDLDRTNTTVNPPRLPALASDYWQREPFTTTDHTNGGYYWSTHAERVYATQPGPVTIVWRKSSPGGPAGNPADVGSTVIGGTTYTIYTNRHLVTSLLAKTPRRMYWTEGPFAQIGKPVTIPTERVRDVKIVYNNRFPERTNEFRFNGQLSGPIEMTNTLWFDRTLNAIRAYNLEGRVFVELLGDKRGTSAGRDVHQQLGYELVDVIQRPTPGDVTIDLGELLTPFQADPPAGTPELLPDPVLTVGQSFAFRHSIAGTPRFEYHAVRETVNQNDFQMHWMEEGLQGLLWPYRYTRYQLIWPVEVSHYSHYVRPLVATEEEAKATAVPLPAPNAPQIAYQDPLDQPRGKLTENFAYYSFLSPDHPAHRALLQFTAGEYVRFERVFSWLDQSLRHTNLTLASFVSGFSAAPTNGTLAGNASISDGVLHLTDALPAQNGWYFLDDFTGGKPIANFRATFNVNINRASALDALGFSFNLHNAQRVAIPGVFNTGVDDGFNLLPAGAADSHYRLYHGTTSGSVSNALLPLASALPAPWVTNNLAAQWLAPTTNTMSSTGVFIYRLSFSLDGFNPASAAILGTVSADDGLAIRINGASVAFNFAGYGGQAPLTITNGFLAGTNTLDFIVTNGSAVVNPTGLRVDNIRASAVRLPGGPLPNGDDGFVDGLTVSFDTRDNYPTDFAPAITIRSNGVQIAGVKIISPGDGVYDDPGLLPVPTDPATGQPMVFATGTDFAPVEVILRDNGTMDVWFKRVKVLDNIPTGYAPRTGNFALGARTGGNYSTHWIDDLAITANFNASSGPAPFTNSVAANLNSWVHGRTFSWPDVGGRPRVFTAPVFVGQRLTAPDGELGGGLDTNYLAGFIQASQGDFYHPGAYVDPFASGFDLANHGAIIPVNAVPGKNLLEVWWFRKNPVDGTRGFQNSFWPAVVGRYTIQWPGSGSEIILAANAGSGPLPSLEAVGTIYHENDRTKPGFNPNEEHALMQGGQAFALRDDLNITNAGANYTSDPFVLLEYTAADGRTAIHPFKVRREKPEAGITFEYDKPAGSILQPPMPLPLLGPAFAPKLPGEPRQALSEEILAWTVSDSDRLEAGVPFWTLTTAGADGPHGFRPFWPLLLQSANLNPTVNRWFYGTSGTANSLRGVVSTNRPVAMGALSGGATQSTHPHRWRFGTDRAAQIPGGTALLASPGNRSNWVVIVTEANAASSYVEVDFGAARPGAGTTNVTGAVLVPVVSGYGDGAFNSWRLAWNEIPKGLPVSFFVQQDFNVSATLTDRKGNIWVHRGPHRADRPETFSMRFYYNTLPGFFFPSRALNDQPPVGTATPYLRPVDAAGQFVGDPVYGNANGDQASDKNALVINYHPVWPGNAPVLQMAETLTTPRRGLPAVRGQSSLQVVYEQSLIETDANDALSYVSTNTSVMLHDPTREKSIEFNQNSLPASVNTESSRGKIYFPNLPPHLVRRFFLDPSRGANGALVFAGEFVDSALGDSYVLLNVAGPQDAGTLKNLCLATDPAKSVWDAAINGLSTTLDWFVENPAAPGTYIPRNGTSYSIPLGAPAFVFDDDVAVDSYALTAMGPKTGFVSLIAGNGSAFTPEGDPVTVHVLRVAPELYRGEVNVIESENPLNERLTLQQVVDLGGRADLYQFEWRITSPVDGQPPDIYTKQLLAPAPLLAAWSHVRFPLATDDAATIETTDAHRVAQDLPTAVAPVSELPFSSVVNEAGLLRFTLSGAQPHRLAVGNQLVMSSAAGAQVFGTVYALPATNAQQVVVSVDPNQVLTLDADQIFRLSERVLPTGPQSIAFTRFDVPPGRNLTEVWLGVSAAEGLGASIYLNGGLVVSTGFAAGNSTPQNPPAGLLQPRLSRYFKLPLAALSGALVGPDGSRTNRLAVAFYSPAAPGALLDFQARVEAFESLDQVAAASSVWLPLDAAQYEDGVRAIVGGSADVRSLSDNYLTMRYVLASAAGDTNRWSQWTEPQLAEGWIKRVLRGINPFNQRVTDLFNNSVNTDVSLLTQAGQRWEGDIALNLDSINSYGLIEIYETVLNRGRNISIGGGINYGPANDALLLAAGYIHDLYMMLGNEASADAANPTIGIGTADNTYGDIATALFSFKGQLPSLLEEELALLRGRDDLLVPGVETRPVYNRMVWNYTRGIDAGEVIYALNYNILDQNTDGRVDAEDARTLFPQGHGDAYGHYLTALKGYYHLFLNPSFDWVPRGEAVLILGKPVSVDYQDERKWAAAAGAMARTGKQVFDLTWRRDFKSGPGHGWSHFRGTRDSNKRTRHWGLDHWAVRTGQGAYLNWIVGNAIVPDVDPDPAHLDTIQQVDRTTVPELKELPSVMESLQVALDNAEAGLTPLGLPENTIPFDLNPLSIANGPFTHFEQIYQRAKEALNNAVVSFDDAKDVTRLMRSEQDSLAGLRAQVDQQELAYTNSLIELYGTPYPEDIGPGKTYRSGYVGPDLIHSSYIDNVELTFTSPDGVSLLNPREDVQWRIDTQTFHENWLNGTNGVSDFSFVQRARTNAVDGTGMLPEYETNRTLYVEYNLASHGFFKKPDSWTGKRSSPGKIQQAIADIVQARNAAFEAFYNADAAKYDLDWALQSLDWKIESYRNIRKYQIAIGSLEQAASSAKLAYEVSDKYLERTKDQITKISSIGIQSIPDSIIAGLAAGGDLFAPVRGSLLAAAGTVESVTEWSRVIAFGVVQALAHASESAKRNIELYSIANEDWNQELRDATSELRDKVYGMNNQFMAINERLQAFDDAQRAYRALLAEGGRIQQEREIFRQRTAAVIQGYRTRDAAFRIFRNEKLERYKALYDLAAQYTYMAAKAYDYDTGLLDTPRGRDFIDRIVQARALGVVQNGVPQFAGSSTGDPGLSSVLAELSGDWSVVKSRLGFNNPDAYGTTVSLRTEHFRFLPGTNGDVYWQNVLHQARRPNLLDDPDVRRYCLQMDSGNGLPVPGLVFEFSTTIADGLNLFGRPLSAGDHAFSPSSFATKIFAAGVSFEGYLGMDNPGANAGAVEGAGGNSPPDPNLAFLDPNALAATPYIYLIPVGVDSMRSPPLGDPSTVRTWDVQDVTIPLPFNIGGSDYSSRRLWQSSDSLTEPLFNIRKHQAFRPISDATLWDDNTIYSTGGELWHNKFTNTRLIGRSVWNSKWKLVIPGRTLLADPDEGLERFMRCVHDIKLYFQTYSYSGN